MNKLILDIYRRIDDVLGALEVTDKNMKDISKLKSLGIVSSYEYFGYEVVELTEKGINIAHDLILEEIEKYFNLY